MKENSKRISEKINIGMDTIQIHYWLIPFIRMRENRAYWKILGYAHK